MCGSNTAKTILVCQVGDRIHLDIAEVSWCKLTGCASCLLFLTYLELKQLSHLAQHLEHLFLVLQRKLGKLSVLLERFWLLLLVYMNILALVCEDKCSLELLLELMKSINVVFFGQEGSSPVQILLSMLDLFFHLLL